MNFGFVTYQTQKLLPQRILVKTTQMSGHLWSAIFNVIVYSHFQYSKNLSQTETNPKPNNSCFENNTDVCFLLGPIKLWGGYYEKNFYHCESSTFA